MPIRLHHRATDVESCPSFEEATFYNIGADEIDARAEQIGQETRLLATLEVRLRAQLRKMELLLTEGLGRVPRVMQQVAAQQGLLWLALVIEPLVDQALRPLSRDQNPHLAARLRPMGRHHPRMAEL